MILSRCPRGWRDTMNFIVSSRQPWCFLAPCVSAIALLLSSTHVLSRDEPASQSLAEMYHSGWTIRDGAPSSIESIAQTQDGYIWLGTDSGLFRFDGKIFERYRPTSGKDLLPETTRTLMATPDGGLWVGYAAAGASFIKDGHNVNFGKPEGLTAGSIIRFARDRSGVIWAASRAALWRYEGSLWKKVDAALGYSADGAASVFVDSRGTVWVGSGRELLYLTEGSKRFEVALEQADALYELAEAPDGTLWIGLEDRSQVRPLAAPDGKLIEHPKAFQYAARRLLFNKDGSLWIASDSQGIYRVPARSALPSGLGAEEGLAQHFSASDGLTSDNIYDLLNDREGSTWVVSTKGLDHFRQAALTSVKLPKNWFRIAIVPDGSDSILAGSNGILHIDRTSISSVNASLKEITCAYRDPQGTIWIGEADGLWSYSSAGLAKVTLPAGLDPLFHVVQTMTMDRDGGLWVSFLHTGFMRYAQGQWSKPSFPSASTHDPGLSAYTDSAGRVWFGLKHSRVEVLSGKEQIRYGPETGIDIGEVTAFYERSGQVWIGGWEGVAFQKQNGFHSLHLLGDAAIEGVSGIIQLASGDLWVNQASGVLRIPADEVERALQNPQYRARFTLYTYLDGLTDTAAQIRPNPTLALTDSGRLYIASRTGVAWTDLNSAKPIATSPLVFVKSMSVDGKLTRDPKDLRLPVHASAIEIDYTATSLLIPERVLFKYKLDGLDKDWQDAGVRRQAFYTGLSPGRYRFRVLACNSDGIWNENGASIDFEIPPSFLQSPTFKLLCAILAIALLALLYRIRLRLVMHQIRTRLYERLRERERIARDLHDTFFQAIQGLLLRFNTGTSLLKPDEPARAIFDEALAQSDLVMMEGRELLLDLRTGSGEASSLSEAFAAAEVDLRTIRDVNYKVIVHGEPKALHPVVFEEVYRLGREALVNAFRHSNATIIEAELIYESQALRVRFRDDGIGIDPTILNQGRRANHWGLPGMRERAKKIGAHIEIWSRGGAGTEIEVRIPARVAYATTKVGLRSRLFGMLFSKEHEVL
jgi:signal transduction histidine kinase/ligand-binding sensor domain-containing protein